MPVFNEQGIPWAIIEVEKIAKTCRRLGPFSIRVMPRREVSGLFLSVNTSLADPAFLRGALDEWTLRALQLRLEFKEAAIHLTGGEIPFVINADEMRPAPGGKLFFRGRVSGKLGGRPFVSDKALWRFDDKDGSVRLILSGRAPLPLSLTWKNQEKSKSANESTP